MDTTPSSLIPKEAQLHDELSRFFHKEKLEISPIVGGASSRKYFRIYFLNGTYFPSQEIAVMVIPEKEIHMLTDYVNVDYYLRRMGVPTPRIYEIVQDKGWIFLEYVSAPTVEQFLHQAPEQTERILTRMVEFIVEMQRRCRVEDHCPAFQRRFDYDKYMFEFNFHVREQLLSFYLDIKLEGKIDSEFKQFAEAISKALDIDHPIFVHRDFQSSNVFYDPETEALKVIDFQDARHGTPVYDLVSAVWDSYIEPTRELREHLVREFYSVLKTLGLDWSLAEYQKMIDYTLIQRKLHDAGAFAYNFRRFGNKYFTQFIPGTLDMVLERLEKYPEFSSVFEILKKAREKL